MQEEIFSPAAQVIISVIPIVGIVIGGVIVFFFLLWRHHEIKLQLKTGAYKARTFDLKTFSLLTGILLAGTGFVLTLFFAFINGRSLSLLGGLIPCVIGICLLIFYKVNPEFRD